MPSPTPFRPVSTTPAKKHKRGDRPQLKATVSQATRNRLIDEAMQSPAYEGMSLEEVSAFVNSKLDIFISQYPWWYGHLPKDKPRQATNVQLKSLEKVRQRKVAIKREVESPYIPEALNGTVA